MATGTKRPAHLSPTQHVAMRRNVERIAAEKVKEDPTAAHFHRVLRGLLDEQRAEGVNNNSRSRARHVAAKTTTATPRRGANRGRSSLASTCHADAQKLRDHLASLLKNVMPKDQIDDWLVELVRGRFCDLAIGPSAPPS